MLYATNQVERKFKGLKWEEIYKDIQTLIEREQELAGRPVLENLQPEGFMAEIRGADFNEIRVKILEMLESLPIEKQLLFAKVVEVLKPEPEPLPDPTENASVNALARSVMSRLLTNEVGEILFEKGIFMDVFEGLFLDIQDAIISGLAHCDTTELHAAAVAGSVR